ncbi:MAG: class I SAM-dependent methyltransferase [Candidatus Riflebacteria bacterium]|nr:class I SAM-dependent methyltransferase [Candidatus Riflebacteria bacterium]
MNKKISRIFVKKEYLNVTYPLNSKANSYPKKLVSYLVAKYIKKPGKLLDIGMGRGDHLGEFLKLGFDSFGIDISPVPSKNQYRENYILCNLEDHFLPFSNESFDFIFCKSVIEHLNNVENMLFEIKRILKANGKAIIMTPSWMHTYWGPFYLDHTHITPFTQVSLENILSIVGFKKICVEEFYQIPILWSYPFLYYFFYLFSYLPLPYRPLRKIAWSEKFNKVIRFSKEVMLLACVEK